MEGGYLGSKNILCGIVSPLSTPLIERSQEAKQRSQFPQAVGAFEPRQKAGRQVGTRDRWHELRSRDLPERALHEVVKPPGPPTLDRRSWDQQPFGQLLCASVG